MSEVKEKLEAGWERIASINDVEEGDVLSVQSAGQSLALYKVEGQLYATHGICSHEHAYLADGYLEGCEIECPLHQARFDIRTGEALCKPASVAIKTYPIKVVDDGVFVKM